MSEGPNIDHQWPATDGRKAKRFFLLDDGSVRYESYTGGNHLYQGGSPNLIKEIARLAADKKQLAKLHNKLAAELEQAIVQLAGCLTAAEGHEADCNQGDYGWTPAYEAICILRTNRDVNSAAFERVSAELEQINEVESKVSAALKRALTERDQLRERVRELEKASVLRSGTYPSLPEYDKQIAAAERKGAEDIREKAANLAHENCYDFDAEKIRALPLPGDE